MLPARQFSLLIVVGLALAACANAPFVVEPDPEAAAANGVDLSAQRSRLAWEPAREPELVSLCSSHRSPSTEVEAAAIEACPSGRVTRVAEDTFWNGCPLLQPFRASFICEPPTVVKVQ